MCRLCFSSGPLGAVPEHPFKVEADLKVCLPVMGIALPERQIRQILEEAEQVLSPYVGEQGRVSFDLTAPIVKGRKS